MKLAAARKNKAVVRKLQYGAVPWRESAGGIEVLLITSRETRRWVIPKGWPIRGLAPGEIAAREAFEEAGVGGVVSPRPLGHFDYGKLQPDGTALPCRVEVYGLEVMIQHRSWPEQGQRDLAWLPASKAAGNVAEQRLARIIEKLK